MSYDDLNQMKLPYRQKSSLSPQFTYEGDIKITTKHSQDYYLQTEEEPETDLNILYTDIEIYSEEKVFPKPEDANYPVCMITNWYHRKFTTYVIDPKFLTDKKQEIKQIDGINELIVEVATDLVKIDPKFTTAYVGLAETSMKLGDLITAIVPMIRTSGQLYEYACHEGNYGMVNTLRAARMEEQDAGP